MGGKIHRGASNFIVVGCNDTRNSLVAESAIQEIEKTGRYEIKVFDLGDAKTKDSWVYLNYVQIGNKILLPVVGDKLNVQNDDKAIEFLNETYRQAFPEREVKIIPIEVKKLMAKGGALHCISWNAFLH